MIEITFKKYIAVKYGFRNRWFFFKNTVLLCTGELKMKNWKMFKCYSYINIGTSLLAHQKSVDLIQRNAANLAMGTYNNKLSQQ